MTRSGPGAAAATGANATGAIAGELFTSFVPTLRFLWNK
jgi:hypothetical protein